MNPSEGRVPVSWNECADWLEVGGAVVLEWNGGPTIYSADKFREGTCGLPAAENYRLLPPPGLVAAPEGMDGGGWLGQGKDVPDGWEWTVKVGSGEWETNESPLDDMLVQCRPPVPKREPEWVPLTKLVGRTVWGETEPVAIASSAGGDCWVWSNGASGMFYPISDGTLDLDTGRVKVEPEEEQ